MRRDFELIWTAGLVFDLTSSMRRELRIRVMHESNRLGAEFLRQAYEMVLPVNSRRLRNSVADKEIAATTQHVPGKQRSGA